MSLVKVFVYVDESTKESIGEVAHRLKMSESNLMRSLALPHVRALRKALEQGADPKEVKRKLAERVTA